MQLIQKTTNIDFIGRRKLAMFFSVALIIASIVSLAVQRLNLGIDFTGGTLIEVEFKQSIEPSDVRNVLTEAKFTDVLVQHFGTSHDLLIRLAPHESLSSAEISTQVLGILERAYPDQVELRRVEFVGPQIGDELTEQGGLAMLYALIGILVYVSLRFEKRFAAGSVIALAHDVIITIGFFSITRTEFDLSVLAAVLAVIGYSLNDTIVVFDRIRENFRRMRKGTPVEVMNISINQTLSRTIMTSFTTLLVLIALFFFGGEIIHGFAIALIVGIVIGTYSSIYVASTLALVLGASKADLMPVKKEGAETDGRP